MRVLMLDQTGQLGGAEFAMLELCERADFEWSAVLFGDGPFKQKLEALGHSVEVISASSVVNVRRSSKLKSLITLLPDLGSMVSRIAKKAKSFDVIYANTQKAMVLGALAGMIARRPVVWYLHDIVDETHFSKIQLTVVKWLSKTLLAKVICNSDASRKAFVNLTGIKSAELDVVYNGIPSAAFDAAIAEDTSVLRERFGLPADAFLVGCFSRLAEWKGQHVLIDAIAKDPDAHAVLVGAPFFNEEPYAQSLHQKVAQLSLQSRVHFVGFHSDIPGMMRAVDVVAHTSIAAEPFGRVVVEGMLAGRPVIASRAGGVPEIIQHMKSGLLVEPDNATALASSISTLRRNPELTARLVADAGERARTRFTPEEHTRSMTSILRRCVIASQHQKGWPESKRLASEDTRVK